MYFPKLIELVRAEPDLYDSATISKLDDYLGGLEEGSTFLESGFNFQIADVSRTEKYLSDLIDLGLISKNDDDSEVNEYNQEINHSYNLIQAPQKQIDKNYQDYISKKRQIDSFSIIYQKTKSQHSGALTLIDLKGYSKNVNNQMTNAAILLLIEQIQGTIDKCIKPYFLNSYSGIEIKHNGDGWFLYFLNEHEAYEFLKKVLQECASNVHIKNSFNILGTSLKCYIHHAKEIEKIYKVDTLRFDMEGQDVILIHMLEKPIEKALYDGTIPTASNFIAITEGVLDKIGNEAELFSELKSVKIDIKDSEGNSKVNNFDMGIYYREF